MYLFDDIARRLDCGADEVEGAYHYLNRSGRPEVGLVRAKFSEFLERYPGVGRANMLTRLKSDDDVAHYSAVFELMLHEALLCVGATIEAIEPKLAHTDRSPDFLVRSANGARFYLEATLATGMSDADRRSKRLFDEAVQAVNEVASTHFLLSARFSGMPSGPIRRRRLRFAIESWLATLDYDEVKALGNGAIGGDAPFRYEEKNLTVELWPIPVKDPGQPVERAIGMQWGDAWSKTVGGALKSALSGKARRYGDLDLPYVIAVNGLDHNEQRHDVLAALFGQEVVRFPLGPNAGEPRLDRDWDGLWIRPDGARRCRGVTGVLVCDDLSIWSAARKDAVYVGHPAPRMALDNFPLPVTTLLPKDDNLVETAGATIGHIIGLPTDWPASES